MPMNCRAVSYLLSLIFSSILIFFMEILEAEIIPSPSPIYTPSYPIPNFQGIPTKSPTSKLITKFPRPYVPIQQFSPSRRPILPLQLMPEKASYFHPGALILRGRQWDGGDHLFNLTNNIGIYVEIIRPPHDTLYLNEEAIRNGVESIFSRGGITPVTLVQSGTPPLPFFHIQILLHPITNGYAICCEGRLFESVLLRRVVFDPGVAFQAITWEKTSLLVEPLKTTVETLERSVTDITEAFIERFHSYEHRQREPLLR